ncbi:MAG: hypothetical protein Q8P11_00310 [bacterium]|nr:hypothetical protein [bacterium]
MKDFTSMKRLLRGMITGIVIVGVLFISMRTDVPRAEASGLDFIPSGESFELIKTGVNKTISLVGKSTSAPVNVTSSTPDDLQWVWDTLKKALEAATYQSVIYFARSFTSQLFDQTFDWIGQGLKGQQPLFNIQELGQSLIDAASGAGGILVEGIVDGFITQYEHDSTADRMKEDLKELVYQADQCRKDADNEQYECYGTIPDDQCDTRYKASLNKCAAIDEKHDKVAKDAQSYLDALQTHQKELGPGGNGAISSEAKQFLDKVICSPSPELTLKIGLTLFPDVSSSAVRKPVCSLTEAVTNWGDLIQKTGTSASDFGGKGWRALGDLFDPNSTQLGIMFNAQLAYLDAINTGEDVAWKKRQEETPFKNVVETVSGSIKTPGSIAGYLAAKAIDESAKPSQLTGNLMVDLGSVVMDSFKKSLLSKATDWFKSGLVETQASGIYSVDTFQYVGVTAARNKKVKFVPTVRSRQRDNIDLMSRLSAEPTIGNPDARVMSDGMATALQTGMTVRSAIRKGYLHTSDLFGFQSNSAQPSPKENLPYDSLVVLRKYRIIPVTWEYAALYIKKYPTVCDNGTKAKSCTLGDMIDGFNDEDSPFFGLVDDTWILQLPPTRCALEGYGPENALTDNDVECIFDTNGDGVIDCGSDFQSGNNNQYDVRVPQMSRQDTCVDEQTCLQSDGNGNCVQGRYGYCIQEQPSWQFDAENCDKQFDSCRSFVNTNKGTTLTALTSTIPAFSNSGGSICTNENKGCQVYSNTRSTDSVHPWVYKPNLPDTDEKEYFNSKVGALECDQSDEGCQLVTNDRSNKDDYYKIAPVTLQCGFEQDGFDSTACKQFVTQCTEDYQGCEYYSSDDGGEDRAGKNPQECESSCAGLQVYTKIANQFDSSEHSVAFIPEKARQCSAQADGCAEFTNLSNETKQYFSTVQACEKTPAEPTPFYSWYGSDTSGFKLSVVNLKTDANDAPVCAPDPKDPDRASDCECDQSTFSEQRDNPLTNTFSCREYINRDGYAFYRDPALIVYQTDDCSEMRRTTGGAEYVISPSHSISCSPSAIGCRRFEGTRSGNIATGLISTFEDGTIGGWQSSTGKLSPSSSGLVADSDSLRVEKKTSDDIEISHGNVMLHNGYGYIVTFYVKGASNATVSASLSSPELSGSYGLGEFLLNTQDDDWERVRFALPNIHTTADSFVAVLHITHDSGEFFIDDVIVSEVQDVVYAIDTKLNVPSSCTAAIDKTRLGAQLGCRLYSDTKGKPVAFTTLDESCKMEFVGCDKFTVHPANGTAYTQYFVPDLDKRCSKNAQSCTAFGIPSLDSNGKVQETGVEIGEAKEKWKTVYYKFDPSHEDTKAAQCQSTEVGCSEYQDPATKSLYYFKDPGTKLCKWSKGDSGRNPGWILEDESEGIVDCNQTPARDIPVVQSGMTALCPQSENNCRAIIDPECQNDGSLRDNYGQGGGGKSACQSAYYIKTAPNKIGGDTCSKVNPAVGCLLFHDPLAEKGKDVYTSHDIYNDPTKDPEGGINLLAGGSAQDANALYQVGLNRQCKVWLACTSSIVVPDLKDSTKSQEICLERRPCDEWGSTDEPCAEFYNPPYVRDSALLGEYSRGGVAVARTLSGIARPNFVFPALSGNDSFTVTGGHDSTFAWDEKSEADASKDQGGRLVNSLITGWNNDDWIRNSCRLYPQKDAPDATQRSWNVLQGYNASGEAVSSKAIPVDACYYQDKNLDRQNGLYGYCLESYPKNNSLFQSKINNVHDAGYQGYCLNWYPVSYIQGQVNVLEGQNALPAYQGPKPLYYCVQSKGGAQGMTPYVPASTDVITGYGVKTRDTSIFRFKDINWPTMQLRDTAFDISNAINADDLIAQGAHIKVVDATTRTSPVHVPTYLSGTLAYGTWGQVLVYKGGEHDVLFNNTELEAYKLRCDTGGVPTTILSQLAFSADIKENGMPLYASAKSGAQARIGSAVITCKLNGVAMPAVNAEFELVDEPYTSGGQTISSQAKILFGGRTGQLTENGDNTLVATKEGAAQLVRVTNVPSGTSVTCGLDDTTTNPDEDYLVKQYEHLDTFGVLDTSRSYSQYEADKTYVAKANSQNYIEFKVKAVKERTQSNSVNDHLIPAYQHPYVYCTFEGGTKPISKPFTLLVEGYTADSGIHKTFVFVDSIMNSLKLAFSNTARVFEHIAQNLSERLPTYRIAAVSGKEYQVIKPALSVSTENVTFNYNQALANETRSVKVSSTTDHPTQQNHPEQLQWRAVVDTARTGKISVGAGFVSDWIVLSQDSGKDGDSLKIGIRSDILGFINRDVVGYVNVYAVGPLEGVWGGETYKTVKVTLDLSAEDETPTETPTATPTIAPEFSRDDSPVQDTFFAKVWYTNLSKNLNEDRVDEENHLRDGMSPIYDAHTPIGIIIDGQKSSPSLCADKAGKYTLRVVYNYLGDGIWHGIPEGKFNQKFESFDYKFKEEMNCDQNFQITIPSASNATGTNTVSGIQYYIVVKNVTEQRVSKSEMLYIDVPDLFKTPVATNCTTDKTKVTATLPLCNNDLVQPHQKLRTDVGIPETQYVPKNYSVNLSKTLSLSLMNTVEGNDPKSNKVPLGYGKVIKTFETCSPGSDDTPPCCRTTTTVTTRDFTGTSLGIDSVTSSNSPAPYCGGGINCPRPTTDTSSYMSWLKEKESGVGTSEDAAPTRIVSGDGGDIVNKCYGAIFNGGSTCISSYDPLAVQTELIHPQDIKDKFLVTDISDPKNTSFKLAPYQGSVVVKGQQVTTTTHTASGCFPTSDSPPVETSLQSIIPVSLVVRPAMDIPSSITMTSGDIRHGKQIIIGSIPRETVYHWRAELKSIQTISRGGTGDLQWLSFSPAAGMSGTPLGLSIVPEVTQFTPSGGTYKAVIKLFATTPVEGESAKEIEVILDLGQPGALSSQTLVSIASVTNIYSDVEPNTQLRSGLNVSTDDSVLILSDGAKEHADTGMKLTPANAFEKSINMDQITQIDYTIEHRTRNTLPGQDWTKTYMPRIGEGPYFVTVTYGGGSGTINEDGWAFTGKDARPILTALPKPDYAQYRELRRLAPPPVISTTAKTEFTMVAASAQATDVTPDTVFGAGCQAQTSGGIGRDFIGIKPVPAPDGTIQYWQWRYCDDSTWNWDDRQMMDMFVSITIYVRDYCTNIVQVVKEDGEAVPWQSKLADPTTPKDRSGAPFIEYEDPPGVLSSSGEISKYMSLIPPTSKPEQWAQPIDIINDDDLSIAHAQSLSVEAIRRASSICLGGSRNGQICTTTSDCSSEGKCFGSRAAELSERNGNGTALLKKYFATGYTEWHWDTTYKKYIQIGDSPLYTPPTNAYCAATKNLNGTQTVTDTIERKAGRCAVQPRVLRANGAKTSVVDGFSIVSKPNGKTVEIHFNSSVDDQQKPLRMISIDWDDGHGKQSVYYSDNDRPLTALLSQNNYTSFLAPHGEHQFVHTYFNDRAKGKRICVEIADNWGAKNVETCEIVQ